MDQVAEQLLSAVSHICVDHQPPSQAHWECLYAFTMHVHRHRLNVPAVTVRERLIQQGCSFQKANRASGEYKRFVELLALYVKERSA